MEIQKVGGGMYQMDGVTYDLGTLMMAIGFERAENIEAQIVDQANAMKERNRMLEGLSRVLAKLRSMPKGKKDDSNIFDANTFDTGVAKQDGTGNYTAKELFEELGMGPLDSEYDFTDQPDWCWGDRERQEAIELLKGKMDSLNSDSQMDMIRLQGLMSKRDNIYQAITNLMKKDEGSKSTVVSNLR